MSAHIHAQQQGSGGTGGASPIGAAGPAGRLAASPLSAAPALPGRSKCSDNEVWALALAFDGDAAPVAGAAGIKFDVGGAAMGRGWRVKDDLALGVLGSYTESNINPTGSASKTEIESRQLGASATWSPGRRYADGQVSYTSSDHTGRRVISGAGLPPAVASSRREGDQLGLFVESGRSYRWDTMNLVPHGALQHQHPNQDACTETGAGALNLAIGHTRSDSFQTALGVRLEEPRSQLGRGAVAPQVTLRWAHEHGDLSRDANASFVGTAQSFRMNGRSAARDRLQIQGGIVGQLRNGIDLELAYAGELAGGQHVHASFARATWRW